MPSTFRWFVCAALLLFHTLVCESRSSKNHHQQQQVQHQQHHHHHHHHHHQLGPITVTNNFTTFARVNNTNFDNLSNVSLSDDTLDDGTPRPPGWTSRAVAPPPGASSKPDKLTHSAVSSPFDAEEVMAHRESRVNGFVFVKQDVWPETLPAHRRSSPITTARNVVERSMYFDAAIGPQSVVRCVEHSKATAGITCCATNVTADDHSEVECCVLDENFIADGYLGLSLVAVPVFSELMHVIAPPSAASPMPMPTPVHVLIIGLGGGSLPSYLRHHFPDMHITVVEIDAVVVALAKQYFGFCDGPTPHGSGSVTVHVADAKAFLMARTQQYEGVAARVPSMPGQFDIVFFDAFVKNEIPPTLLTREFMKALKMSVRRGGVVVANVFSLNPFKIQSITRVFKTVFPGFTAVVRVPLEMSVVAVSANIDSHAAASFSYPRFNATAQAMVRAQLVPSVLGMVVRASRFRTALQQAVAPQDTNADKDNTTIPNNSVTKTNKAKQSDQSEWLADTRVSWHH